MGVYTWRPTRQVSAGGGGGYTGGTGDWRVMTDNSDSTYAYFTAPLFAVGGYSILGFSTLPVGAIPAGRRIIAIREAHRMSNNFSYGGYPLGYIRNESSARITESNNGGSDGSSSSSWRTKNGPWVYNSGGAESFDPAVLANYSIRIGYDQDPSRVSDVWMDLLYEEPLATPTVPFPANAAIIDTSNPALSVQGAAPQAGQLVRAEFQLARNNTFTTGVETRYSTYHDRVGATERTTVIANPNLGPGLWYMRVRMVDLLGNVSAWSTTSSFTITHAALPVPTNTSPAPGSIAVSPYGIRSARVDTAASDNRDVGMEWQFSQSSTYASGVVTWRNVKQMVRTGAVSYDAAPKSTVAPGLQGYDVSLDDPTQYLPQGTWYFRTRTVDKWGQTSAWSVSDSFTVQHPPQAQNVSPTSSRVIDQNVTPIRWTFGDPWNGDAQTAYQIRVYDETNALIHDTGKLNSTSIQHFLTLSATHLYKNLRYTINLYDKDGVTPASVASNNFIFSNSPAITMPYPAQSEIVLTGQPTFRWNPGIGRPGTTQKSFELRVYRMDNNALVYNTGEVMSAAVTHTPPNVILRNGVDYRLTLRIVDSDNLTSTLNRNFRAEYQAPPEPTVTVDPDHYHQDGYAVIDWSSTVPDPYFTAWKVYRRAENETEWTLIHTEEDSAVRTFRDWLVPSVGNYQYSVTQMADRSGFVLESGLDEEVTPVFLASEFYWLIDEEDESNNVKFYSVADDSFTDEVEMNEYVVKGRGKRVNYGTRIGMNGQLSVRIRYSAGVSASQQRKILSDMQYRNRSVILRDPFGNMTRIAIGQVSTTRIAGVGWQEFADLDIPYMEVF